MDEIYYEKVLNRIIQGRLRVKLGGLVFYIYEPSKEIIEESFDIYQETYDKAYFAGVYIESQMLEMLIRENIYDPMIDKNIKDLSERIDDLKVEAFKNFFKKKQLRGIKAQIRRTEHMLAQENLKKTKFEYATCEGVAKYARKCWLIEHTTKNKDGSPFDFSKLPLIKVMECYNKEHIKPSVFRAIARQEPWRGMWSISKKRDNPFGVSSSDLDSNQLTLSTYSSMYDNVYAHPESPDEKVILDDDCLDGWFVEQRRKAKKDKKQAEVDALIKNPKIANSQEIFLMASNPNEAEEIHELNSPAARNKTKMRTEQIHQFTDSGGENLHFKDLSDVQQDRYMNAVQVNTAAVKRR